ncbi:MAG: substrate-binding domain-containing protein [Selenomonadaceae bacterium]|nr:substrate-binding domain-containing protein [Selenomonadaceae bacterium]
MEVKRFLTGFFLCLTVIFFYCGCGSDESSNLSGKFDDKDKIQVSFISMDKEVPYWEEIHEGCQKAADEFCFVNYEWQAPFERDEFLQSECIEKAVVSGADVIIISAIPGKNVNKSLEKAKKAGVKIIYVDNPAQCEGVITLATDNENAGKTAGETMLKALKDAGIQNGVIGIESNSPDMVNTSLRDKGFRKVFEGSSFVIAPTAYAAGNPNITSDDVEEHPEYVGFFGANQTATLLIGQKMVDSANKQIVVGFDTAAQTLRLIDDGAIYATIKQNTKKMGYDGMKIAVEIMSGEYKGKIKNIDTGVTVITKENLSQVKFY